MKRTILLLLLLKTFSLGCGGCVDSGSVSSSVDGIKEAYDVADSIVAKMVDDHIQLVNKNIVQEVSNHKELLDNVNLQIDTILTLKELNFFINNTLVNDAKGGKQ